MTNLHHVGGFCVEGIEYPDRAVCNSYGKDSRAYDHVALVWLVTACLDIDVKGASAK